MRYRHTLRSVECLEAQHLVCSRYTLDQRHDLRACACHCHSGWRIARADAQLRRDRWHADTQLIERIELERLAAEAR